MTASFAGGRPKERLAHIQPEDGMNNAVRTSRLPIRAT